MATLVDTLREDLINTAQDVVDVAINLQAILVAQELLADYVIEDNEEEEEEEE